MIAGRRVTNSEVPCLQAWGSGVYFFSCMCPPSLSCPWFFGTLEIKIEGVHHKNSTQERGLLQSPSTLGKQHPGGERKCCCCRTGPVSSPGNRFKEVEAGKMTSEHHDWVCAGRDSGTWEVELHASSWFAYLISLLNLHWGVCFLAFKWGRVRERTVCLVRHICEQREYSWSLPSKCGDSSCPSG